MSTEQTNLEQLQKENDRLKAQIELLQKVSVNYIVTLVQISH